MSNRNNRRTPRIPTLSENDRIILNIYLNMYNQTVRDIDLLYQQVDSLYDNLNSIRNIVNIITGVLEQNNTSLEEEEPIVHPNVNLFDTSSSFRPSNGSYYNNNSFTNRFYLLSLARNILDNYDNTYSDVSANRTAGVRTRNRVGVRTPTSFFENNNNSINNNEGNRGLTERLFTTFNSFYDNVPVYPSAEQIRNGTRRVLYSNIVEPLNNSCPITLERFEQNNEVLQIIGCNHIFNPHSLQHWFQNNVRCPVCRYDIREYVPLPNRRRNYSFIDTDIPLSSRRRYFTNTEDEDNDENETKEDETNIQSSATSETSTTSDSTLVNEPNTDETEEQEEPRNTNPQPSQSPEFISNLTSITENLLTDLFSSNFPNSQFNFNGTTYSVDFSNNEIVFQGYINPNDD